MHFNDYKFSKFYHNLIFLQRIHQNSSRSLNMNAQITGYIFLSNIYFFHLLISIMNIYNLIFSPIPKKPNYLKEKLENFCFLLHLHPQRKQLQCSNNYSAFGHLYISSGLILIFYFWRKVFVVRCSLLKEKRDYFVL